MLRDETIELRAWRESDIDALALLRNDVELQALLMSRAKPNSVERVRAWLVERSLREDAIFFIISGAIDSAPMGYLQVVEIDPANGLGELGICIAPSAQGGGVATRACDLLEPYLRWTFSLRKLTLKVLTSNERAIAFYRKYGYREVGVLRGHIYSGGSYQDVLIMERWLGG